MRLALLIFLLTACFPAFSQTSINVIPAQVANLARWQTNALDYLNINADGTIFTVQNNPAAADRHSTVYFIGANVEICMPMADSAVPSRWYFQNPSLVNRDVFASRFLEFRITVNNRVVNDWMPAMDITSVKTDTVSETVSGIPTATIKRNSTTSRLAELLVNGYGTQGKVPVKFKDSRVVIDRSGEEVTVHTILRQKILFNGNLAINDSMLVELRDLGTKEHVSSVILRRLSVTPSLYQTLVDEEIDQYFLQAKTINEVEITQGFDLFAPSSAPKQKLNFNLPAGSRKILLLFASFGNIDSSLMIHDGPQTDSSGWKISGHKVLISDLKPGSTREIYVRYKLQPETTIKYTITVAPAWYQTKGFKTTALSLAGLMVLLGGFLLYRFVQRKNRQREENINLQLKSIRSQLNPHFVFNALSSIQGLINNNEVDKANIYLSEFGGLMRDTLSGNNLINNNLASEIKILDRYLKLEQLRFGFRYSIQISSDIDTAGTEIPSLLLQPIIENAVKHGVSGLLGNGLIQIIIEKEKKDMVVKISDNGKGFNQVNSSGHGLRLTNDRIQLLNDVNKDQPVSCVTNSTLAGTTVHLTFKNWL